MKKLALFTVGLALASTTAFADPIRNQICNNAFTKGDLITIVIIKDNKAVVQTKFSNSHSDSKPVGGPYSNLEVYGQDNTGVKSGEDFNLVSGKLTYVSSTGERVQASGLICKYTK